MVISIAVSHQIMTYIPATFPSNCLEAPHMCSCLRAS